MTNPLANFARNEGRIGKLYRTYARLFPEQKTLWRGLADAEKVHAALLRGLQHRFASERQLFVVSFAGQQILDYVSNFIGKQLELAEAESLSAQEALQTALSLEQSMLERKSFEIFATKNEEVELVLKRLNRETDGHARLLEKTLHNLL